MLDNDEPQARLLNKSDVHAIERLLHTSEYIYQRFTLPELPLLLQNYPAVGIFHNTTMHGFLLSQNIHAPTAWIGGFGVSWTASDDYITILTLLLEHITTPLMRRGVHYLHYSGNDIENDWLQPILLEYGFAPYRRLYAYDKLDYSIPSQGNQQATIRPVKLTKDLPALLAIEEACFEDLWRYDPTIFNDLAATHPYFVVAELNGQVVGYQFNIVDEGSGHLVRIAVHPSFNHKGIGTRLMAEAIRFFQKAQVSPIMLNTLEDNYQAHRLYEWFNFVRLEQIGFVLRKAL